MATIASLAVDVIANTGRFVSDLKKAAQGVEGFEKKTKASFNRLRRSVRRFDKQIWSLKNAMVGLGLGILTKELINQISTYQALTNKIRLVTRDSEHLARTQNDLFNLAQDTRGSLEGTSDLYARLSRSTKNLTLSDQALLDITESVNQAVTISGSSAASSAAALFQFGQGLAADALRGQELNSIMEQTPRLARAIADGMDIELGALREVAAQGLLTADVVVKALQSQSDVLKEEFGRTEQTIGQAMTQIENSVLKAFGEMDASDLIDSMNEFREVITDPSTVKGLQSMAAVMLDMVGLVVRIASGWGMIIGLITDALPSEAEQKLFRINHQIFEQTTLLKSLSSQSRAMNWVDSQFGDTQKQKIDVIIAKINELNEVRKKLLPVAIVPTLVADSKKDGGKPESQNEAILMEAMLLHDGLLKLEQDRIETIQGYKDSAFEYEFEQAIRQEDRIGEMHDQRLAYRLEQERLAAEQWNSIWTDAQDTFTSGMGNAVASVIVDQENLAEAMENLLKNVAKQIISNLVTVAIKQALLSKTAGVQAIILAKSMGAVWAAPAALAATATAGGAAVAGQAALGTFVAANQALSAGQFHNGTDYVPRTGSYILEKGEAVIDKGTSEKMRNNVAGGAQVINYITLQAIDTQSGIDFLQKNGSVIFNENANQMYENGLSYG